MLLRIKDIPAQGKEVDFDLDNEKLNTRIAGDENKTPEYVFNRPANAKIKVSLQGSTVILEGQVVGDYTTCCSRCAEKVTKSLKIPIKMLLKPSKYDSSEEEDLNFGFYIGEEVNCNDIAEELLVLALPIVVHCESEECKARKESWVFGEEVESNNPFKNIKLVH